MGSLEAMLVGFTSELDQLKRCAMLRDIDLNQQTNVDALVQVSDKVDALEREVARISLSLESEMAAVDQAKVVMAEAEAQQFRLMHMKENLPARLPGPTAEASDSAPAVECKPADTNRKRSGKRKTPATKVVPKIEPVLVDEFNGVPQYLRGRLSREQINKAADALYMALVEKYKLLGTPRKQLGERQMAKISGFKEAEHRAVDGKLFVVEADIKMFTSFKLDSAGRTCLSILRHCGRFKEHRGNGYTRLVL